MKKLASTKLNHRSRNQDCRPSKTTIATCRLNRRPPQTNRRMHEICEGVACLAVAPERANRVARRRSPTGWHSGQGETGKSTCPGNRRPQGTSRKTQQNPRAFILPRRRSKNEPEILGNASAAHRHSERGRTRKTTGKYTSSKP